MKDKPESAETQRAVTDRWWVDSDVKSRETVKVPAGPVGSRFYQAARGYEQDRAQARLSDTNLKLLVEAEPPEGTWAYLQLAETAYPEADRERIKRYVVLPPYARGVVVDSEQSVRLLVTGTPLGARILELTLDAVPSFDCWIEGEWVHEELFESREEALKAFRRSIVAYLSPEGIAHWQANRPAT